MREHWRIAHSGQIRRQTAVTGGWSHRRELTAISCLTLPLGRVRISDEWAYHNRPPRIKVQIHRPPDIGIPLKNELISKLRAV